MNQLARRCQLASLLIFFLASVADAQSRIVTGLVSDQNNASLRGASIKIKGSNKGATTDESGKYSINVENSQAVLIFSFAGYADNEVPVGPTRTTINVTMTLLNKALQDVVVVGYGNQRKKALTTAISSVSSKQIKDLPVVSPGAALAGQVAGVSVKATNGSPGQPPVIRVRGMGSILAGNGPLYVVDGYPLEGADAFNLISPSDIESIQVLKDAASAAIYGSRGGNGVIIVTTKRGEKGAAKFSFNSYVGMQQVAKKVDVLNTAQFIEYKKEIYTNKGLPIPAAYANPPADLPNTDWQDQIFRNALQHSYQLSVSGGTDALRYSISGGYLSQEGVVDLTKYQRLNLRISLDAQVSKRVKIGATLMPTYSVTDNKPTQGIINGGVPENGGGVPGGGVVNTAVAMPPLFPVKYANGNYAQPAIDPLYSALSVNLTNPVATLNLYENRVKSPLFLGSAYLEYKILDGLKFKTVFGYQFSQSDRNSYTPATLGRPNFATASLSNPNLAAIAAQRLVGLNNNWISENYFNYDKSFGDNHEFSAIAGYSAQQNLATLETLDGQAGTYANDVVHYVSNAGQILAKTSYNENTLTSLYARINYGYKDKYLLSAAIRRDGSSRFGDNQKYANFPSVSAAWRIKQEKFMDKLDAISELKIRASYGLTGNNNIGNYTWQSYLAQANYVFGAGNGSRSFGYLPSGIANPNLTWETNRQFDIGLELGLFKDRIYFTADMYKRKTEDLLFSKNIPTIVGFSTTVTENVGEVENKGLELGLTSRNMVGKLKWTTNANISWNKNKVLKLVNGNFIGAGLARLTPGESIGTFYGYKHIGIYHTQAEVDAMPWAAGGAKPGDIKYEDVNSDKKIDANDITNLGTALPKFTWGLVNTLEYNNFDLNVIIRGAQGSQVVKFDDRLPMRFAGDVNSRTNVLDRWKSEKEPGNGMEPRVGGVGQGEFSSRWIHDASFIQISNITLGYTLRSGSIKGISGLRLYAAIQNLYTFTKYVGYNPEADNANEAGSSQLGVDQGSYPMARNFLLGLNLNF